MPQRLGCAVNCGEDNLGCILAAIPAAAHINSGIREEASIALTPNLAAGRRVVGMLAV